MSDSLFDLSGTPERETPSANPCIAVYGPGPDGQSCKGCIHLRYPILRSGAKYWKCDLRRVTHGRASDHRVSWPACGRYEARTEEYHGG
jgi:hypothetical protein